MKKQLFGLIVIFLVSITGLHGEKWTNSMGVSLLTKSGNTDYIAYTVNISSERYGDIKWTGLRLEDTEVKLALSHSRGELSDTLYEHKGNASFLFDLQAHQTFSPFFLSYWEYDSIKALENRTQLGLGLKYRLTDAFSVSLAGLWEVEDYLGQDAARQFRWSLRPKYKKSFNSGISVNYIIFFKPLFKDFDNYLIENYATIKLVTKITWLSVTATLVDKYNSQPPAGIKNRDTDVTVGITISF